MESDKMTALFVAIIMLLSANAALAGGFLTLVADPAGYAELSVPLTIKADHIVIKMKFSLDCGSCESELIKLSIENQTDYRVTLRVTVASLSNSEVNVELPYAGRNLNLSFKEEVSGRPHVLIVKLTSELVRVQYDGRDVALRYLETAGLEGYRLSISILNSATLYGSRAYLRIYEYLITLPNETIDVLSLVNLESLTTIKRGDVWIYLPNSFKEGGGTDGLFNLALVIVLSVIALVAAAFFIRKYRT